MWLQNLLQIAESHLSHHSSLRLSSEAPGSLLENSEVSSIFNLHILSNLIAKGNKIR